MRDDKAKEPRFHGVATSKSHYTMSQIHGKDTSIELTLRKALWKKGYRYRKNYKALPGTPDIAITKYRVAVFCDGEFFHGKDWEDQKPKVQKGKNADYWTSKIEHNMERDKMKDQELTMMGWTVIHFWGKEIMGDTDTCIKVIEEAIFDKKMEE